MRLTTCHSAAAIAIMGALLVSCSSLTTGNEGNLTFAYIADENLLDFNKPIAVGALLDLRVTQAGNQRAVEIVDATSGDTSALEVVSFDGAIVTVRALAEGNVLLTVEAETPLGVALSDSVNLTTRAPDNLFLKHSCTDDANGLYLVDMSDVWLRFDMSRDNGQPVIGYGYFPVTVDPAASFALDESRRDPQWMHFATGSEPDSVTIDSDIDDTGLTLELVEAADIDGAIKIGSYPALIDLPTWYYLLPTIDEVPICQAFADLTVTVDTPTICDVTVPADQPSDAEIEAVDESADIDEPSGGLNESGWLRVVGSQIGTCEFTVDYREGNDGAGTAVEMSVDIIEIVGPEDE